MSVMASAAPFLRVTLRAVGGVAALGAILWLAYLGLTWDLRASEEGADGFRAVEVVRGSLRETVPATGVTEPMTRIVVQSEIPGIVARVYVDDGSRVQAGAPLIELDDERLEHRVAELRASLEVKRAEARYDLTGRARSDLDLARREYERVRKLFERGVLSERDVDEARHALEQAQIDLSDARAEQFARRAAVDQAKEALRQAERDLEKAVIRAPADAVVVRRPVEIGTAVADLQNGGTVIAVLADDSKIHVVADVDENDVAPVRVGQQAEITIDAFPTETLSGVVRKVSLAGSSRDGVANFAGTSETTLSNFEIEIELEPDERIRVGMSADARVVVHEHRDVLLVPNTAIVRTDEGPKVRVPNGSAGSYQMRQIDTGYSDGFQTIVVGGLAPGDRVLVHARGKRDS